MDDLISKRKFLDSLIHCSGLTLQAFDVLVEHIKEYPPDSNGCCKECDSYKKESERYKRKYEIAKSGLTKEERNILITLICNEQVKLIANKEYASETYILLEQLKAKIRTV